MSSNALKVIIASYYPISAIRPCYPTFLTWPQFPTLITYIVQSIYIYQLHSMSHEQFWDLKGPLGLVLFQTMSHATGSVPSSHALALYDGNFASYWGNIVQRHMKFTGSGNSNHTGAMVRFVKSYAHSIVSACFSGL